MIVRAKLGFFCQLKLVMCGKSVFWHKKMLCVTSGADV